MVLDAILGAGILISALLSFLRGFVREVLTIVGVVGGAAAALTLGPALTPTTAAWFQADDPQTPKIMGLLPPAFVADALAYVIIFVAVMIILSIISHVLATSVRSIGLGALDRTLGFAFGVARGVVVFALLYMPFHFTLSDDIKKEWFGESVSFVYLDGAAHWIQSNMPEGTDAYIAKTRETVDQVRDTRDKLEAIDVLGTSQDTAPEKKSPDQPDQKTEKPAEGGYGIDATKAMDNLIKLQTIQKQVFEQAAPDPEKPALEKKP